MVRWDGIVGKETADGTAGAPPRFAGLSVASLRREVEAEGRPLPVGTKETVVAAYGGGVGYEVEFFAPFRAVVTLEVGDLAS